MIEVYWEMFPKFVPLKLSVPALEYSHDVYKIMKKICMQIRTDRDYRISSIIRQSFSFQNNPKDLDPSYKMDLDLWDCSKEG